MSAAQVRELPSGKPANITTEIMRITPAMAEKMLGKNVKNRRISARVVERYRRAIVAGEWLVTGEAIKFASNGDLLDGQHRLLAVLAAEKPAEFMVVKGLPAEAQDVMDTGRARSVGDQLSIAGYPNATVLAAVARVVVQYATDSMASDLRVSTPEVRALVEDNALIAFAASRALAISKGCDLRPSIAGAAFYELMKVDDAKAQEFFDRLVDGANLPAGSPILVLRAKLRAIRDDRQFLPTEALMSLVFRTWNAWRVRRSISSLALYNRGAIIPCPLPK